MTHDVQGHIHESDPPVECFDSPAVSSNLVSWTDARVDQLKTLWDAGLSCSQIAAKLGHVTRNAVISKVTRLGLQLRGKGGNNGNQRSKPGPKPRPKFANPLGPAAVFPRKPKLSPELKAMRCAEIEPLGVGLFELERGQCRYPYGAVGEGDGVTFCGHPAEKERSYCSAHQALTTRGWVEK